MNSLGSPKQNLDPTRFNVVQTNHVTALYTTTKEEVMEHIGEHNYDSSRTPCQNFTTYLLNGQILRTSENFIINGFHFSFEGEKSDLLILPKNVCLANCRLISRGSMRIYMGSLTAAAPNAVVEAYGPNAYVVVESANATGYACMGGQASGLVKGATILYTPDSKGHGVAGVAVFQTPPTDDADTTDSEDNSMNDAIESEYSEHDVDDGSIFYTYLENNQRVDESPLGDPEILGDPDDYFNEPVDVSALDELESTSQDSATTDNFSYFSRWYDLAEESTDNLQDALIKLAQNSNFAKFRHLTGETFDVFSAKPNLRQASQLVKIIDYVVRNPDRLGEVFEAHSIPQETDTDYRTNLIKLFKTLYKFAETENQERLLSEDTIHLHWYRQAKESTDGLEEKWEKLMDIPDFDEFATMLCRLGEKELKNKVNALEVVEVIQTAIKSHSFSELIFFYSQKSGADCHERPLSLFKTIQGFVRFHQLENINAEPKLLLKLAKGMVRQTLLETAAEMVYKKQWAEERSYEFILLKINRKQNEPLDESAIREYDQAWAKLCKQFEGKETLEYHLALCQVLEKDLKLPFPVNSVYAVGVADLTDTDIELAKEFVITCMANQENLVDILVAQPFWYEYIKKQCKVEIDDITNKFAQQLDELREAEEAQNTKPQKVVSHDSYLDNSNTIIADMFVTTLAPQLDDLRKVGEAQNTKPQKVVGRDSYLDKSNAIMAAQNKAIETQLKNETQKLLTTFNHF